MLLVVSLVAHSCLIARPPDADTQGKAYTSFRALYDSSDRVVVASLDALTTEVLEDSMKGVLYSTFTVETGHKGSAKTGDEIHVLGINQGSLERINGEFFELVVGAKVVIFLKGRARYGEYPAKYGGTLWTLNGDPALATVGADGMLEFVYDASFLRDLERTKIDINLDLLGQE